MPSTFKTVLEAVHARILTLGLPIPSTQIYKRELPTDREAAGIVKPAVIVSGLGQETAEEGTSAQFAWGYPILVSIVYASNQDLTVKDDWRLCRQLIRNAFNDKTIPGASSVVLCRIEFRDAVNPQLFWSDNVTVSELLIRAISWEDR